MEIIDHYKAVFQKFSDFKTRSSRPEFWYFVLGNIILSFLFGLVSQNLSFLYSLVILIPSLAVGARRLHDIGKSGWTQLWALLPIIGWIYLIVLFAKEGDIEENKWGKPTTK